MKGNAMAANLEDKEDPRGRMGKIETYIRRFVLDGGEPQFNIGPLLTLIRGVGDKNGLMPRSFRELRENLDICSRVLPEDPAPDVLEPPVDSDMRMSGRSEYRPKRFSNGSILKEMFQNLFAYWPVCNEDVGEAEETLAEITGSRFLFFDPAEGYGVLYSSLIQWDGDRPGAVHVFDGVARVSGRAGFDALAGYGLLQAAFLYYVANVVDTENRPRRWQEFLQVVARLQHPHLSVVLGTFLDGPCAMQNKAQRKFLTDMLCDGSALSEWAKIALAEDAWYSDNYDGRSVYSRHADILAAVLKIRTVAREHDLDWCDGKDLADILTEMEEAGGQESRTAARERFRSFLSVVSNVVKHPDCRFGTDCGY
mgnify:CR=1 FL=1